MIELCDKINGPIILLGGKDEVSTSKTIENFFKYSETSIREKLNKKTLIYNLCGKLNIEESAMDPTFFPLIEEPNPSAASSINIRLFFFCGI